MELRVQTRTVFGKKTKALRKNGFVPAEVFGHGFENKHLTVSAKDFLKIFEKAGENTVIDLSGEKEKMQAFISEVQYEPLSRKILSIDFRQIRMDEKIQAKAPLELTGEAPAAKNGFLVIQVLKEIEVEALPAKIPHLIEINIASLETIGQNIRVGDIKTPSGVKILTPAETTIVVVNEAAKEEKKETETAIETETAKTETQPVPEKENKNPENSS